MAFCSGGFHLNLSRMWIRLLNTKHFINQIDVIIIRIFTAINELSLLMVKRNYVTHLQKVLVE